MSERKYTHSDWNPVESVDKSLDTALYGPPECKFRCRTDSTVCGMTQICSWEISSNYLRFPNLLFLTQSATFSATGVME
jgi:hypothetical protein